MITNSFIINKVFNFNDPIIISFKYNIKTDDDYGIGFFVGNNNLLGIDLTKFNNRSVKEGLGMFGKTYKSQIPSIFSIGIDNKGYFSSSYGNIINGKDELNNYNTISIRYKNNIKNNYSFYKDFKLDKNISILSDDYNIIRFRITEFGTKINIDIKNNNNFINILETKLPGCISSYVKENNKAVIGLSGLYSNDGELKIKDIICSN